MTERNFFVQSDVVEVSGGIEMHNVVKHGETGIPGFQVSAATKEMINDALLDAPSWLPFAAERYNISPDIRDYVIMTVPIMPSDLPNRNNVAFPYSQLTAFNTDSGMIAYKTWKGKPMHVEHQNKDYTKAKGVILDSALRPMKGYKGNLWKVLCLGAIDRTRDVVLANQIMTGERPCYSMGAFCNDYTCSICGASLAEKGGCPHLMKGDPTYKMVDNKVACWNIFDMIGYELSNVASPAYLIAEQNTDELITLD